jgi:flagellar biosynthetic protein FliR
MPPSGLLGIVVATALGAARLLPVLWLVAPLGGPRLPATVRVGFALVLALVAAPVLVVESGTLTGFPNPPAMIRGEQSSPAPHALAAGAGALADVSVLRFTLLLAREVVVGLCLGLVASAAFRAAEVAGRLGDTLRGANVAEILVPTAEERASPLGVLYLLLATVVFFQIGGVPRLVDALLSSYRTLPIGGGLGEPATRHVALVVMAASAKLIASGLALAAPVVVAIWLTDLALGLIARAAPSVPVYFLGLPLKGLLAVGVVLLGLGLLQNAFAGGFLSWFRMFAQAVAALRG